MIVSVFFFVLRYSIRYLSFYTRTKERKREKYDR